MSSQDLTLILKKILTTQTYKWRARAACKDINTELFFPDMRGINADKYIKENLPCHKCKVKQDCIDFADDTGEEWGIWGGEYRTPKRMAQLTLLDNGS